MQKKVTGREQFEKYKFIFNFITFVLKKFPRKLRYFFWNMVNSWKGKAGVGLRYCIFKSLASACGDNVYIAADVEIKNIQNIKLGSNVSIHRFCYIDAIGGLNIGNDVSIAHNTSIISFDHTWQNPNESIKYNPVKLNSISISDDVWIGCGARILAGVNIASRSIVASGAVVKCCIETNSLYGGIPAKLIKKI